MDRSIGLAEAVQVVVMAILISLMGVIAILRTPTETFPNISVPDVSIIWNNKRPVPKETSDRIISVTERNLTTVSTTLSTSSRCMALRW